MIENKNTDTGSIIANPPYGPIGSKVTMSCLNNLSFDTYINLEPGNDYFLKEKLYKHIDTSFRPVILRNGCFKDASQTTVMCKLQKEENNLSEIEARILLHIDTNGNKELLDAITEYLLKVNTVGVLNFRRTNLTRRNTFIAYDPDLFLFNSGSFDVYHGYFAVATKDKTNWTSATAYNVFAKEFTPASATPASKVQGCKQFKKLIYSELGLSIIKVLFRASPEGWGLTGMFADIDYSNCRTVVDYFNKIGLSNISQNIIFEAASKIKLTDKEKEICKIVETI